MSAERVTHSRMGAPPPANALASKSTFNTAPTTRSSSAVLGALLPASNRQRSTAMMAICGAGAGRRADRSARRLFRTRRLAKQYALSLLGDRVLGVDGSRLFIGAHRRRPLADALEPALEV